MNLLPFGQLPAFTPRRFVAENTNLGVWAEIAPWFDQLEAKAQTCASVADFERWLLDWSELSAALDEESSRRYIAMTCHTDNTDAEKDYLHFVENVEPRIKPRQFQLAQIYLAHPLRAQLPKTRYEVFDRNTRVQVDLFRPENVELETGQARKGQEYQKICGAMTVPFRGEEKTLIQMGRYLEEPERPLRQEAWELVARRRLQDAGKLEEIFDVLVALREKIAANAGFANYLDYTFRAKCRFDYTAEDCRNFHAAIEEQIVPLLRELQARRREQLGLSALRPWDLAVDPMNHPPLRPFEQVEQLVERTQKIFDSLNGDLADDFQKLQKTRLLDLANRKGKAPGGYQSTLAEARVPFIFMNAVGVQRDVETLLHEAGHAFHALASRDEPFHAYREAPIEFCEVASMSMELLGNEHLEYFYAPPEARRARRDHLEGIVEVFPWIATVDAFQHWIYTHPGHTRAERAAAWVELMNRFGGDVDWSGYERERANLWHRQLHIFLHPFYYVEYGIAQLGALQIWANSKADKAKALREYRRGLALGGSRPLPELFSTAGCRFEFNARSLKPFVALLRRELAALED